MSINLYSILNKFNENSFCMLFFFAGSVTSVGSSLSATCHCYLCGAAASNSGMDDRSQLAPTEGGKSPVHSDFVQGNRREWGVISARSLILQLFSHRVKFNKLSASDTFPCSFLGTSSNAKEILMKTISGIQIEEDIMGHLRGVVMLLCCDVVATALAI